MASECQPCPKGLFCPVASKAGIDCPAGSYCPEGTESATQYLCPNGTFSNRSNIWQREQCQACPPGMFCNGIGLVKPSGLCSEGFFCASGAATPTPGWAHPMGYIGDTCVDMSPTRPIGNGLCPPGHWCPRGTPSPIPCPSGTMSWSFGLTNSSQCQACQSGYFCPDRGIARPHDPCPPGFFCPGGDTHPRLLCPPGHRCEGNNSQPFSCPAGALVFRLLCLRICNLLQDRQCMG